MLKIFLLLCILLIFLAIKHPKPYLFYLLILLVVAEVFLRFYFRGSVSAVIPCPYPRLILVSSIIPSEYPKLVYELNPDYPGINSFGMRGQELNPNEIKGKYIIAAIGDSHTYSIESKTAESAYPQRLEYHIDEIIDNYDVKVLNFGVPGYNTSQELEALRRKALGLHPNLVILQYAINDTHICNYIQPKNKVINSLIHKSSLLVYIWKSFLYSSVSKQYFYEYIARRFPDCLLYMQGLVGTLSSDVEREIEAHRYHPARTKDRVPARYHYMLGRNNFEKHIREFAGICKKAKIAMLATGFIEKGDRGIFLKEGFDVYSFFEIFKNTDMKLYGYDREATDTHLNDSGSDFIAKALAYYIKSHYFDKN